MPGQIDGQVRENHDGAKGGPDRFSASAGSEVVTPAHFPFLTAGRGFRRLQQTSRTANTWRETVVNGERERAREKKRERKRER